MPLSLPATASALVALTTVLTGCAASHASAADPPTVAQTASEPPPTPTPSPTPTPTPFPSASLTADIRAYLKSRPGELSLAVRDQVSGDSYSFNTSLRTVTASIVKADILTVLLLQAQKAGHGLSSGQKGLAEQMIEASDNNAASALWDDIGQGDGLAAGNRRLRLKSTVPGPGGAWGITTTSAADQLRLLTALTSSTSPLNATGRSYVLGLMSQVERDQRWGVSAAADDSDDVALKNGWLPRAVDGGTWTINSIGRIKGDGHDYLIAVISQGHPSMSTGIATVEHVTRLVGRALGDARGN